MLRTKWTTTVLSKLLERRSIISTWLIFSFLIIVVLSAVISEFFQAPSITSHNLKKYTLLFDPQRMEAVQSITVDNHLGKYIVEKRDSYWELTSPRKLPANKATIGKIKQTLAEILIQKILTKDPINVSNFSLKTPMVTLTLGYGEGDEQSISFGLKNSIDNSTYVSISNKDAIFQVNAPPSSFEALTLGDFIDSKIFPIPVKDLTSLTIYKGDQKYKSVRLKIENKNNLWVNKKGKELNQEKVREYLEKLFTVKSEIILDKINEKLQKRLDRYLKKPAYSVEIEGKNNFKASYIISNIIGTLPGVKIEKWHNFIVVPSNRSHPYLVDKRQHYHFAKTERPFRKVPIKKLFY